MQQEGAFLFTQVLVSVLGEFFSQAAGLTLWQGADLALCSGDGAVQSSAPASKLPRADASLVQRDGKKQRLLGALLKGFHGCLLARRSLVSVGQEGCYRPSNS